VAKKNTARKTADASETTGNDGRTPEQVQQEANQSPDVRSAAEAVRLAEAELEKARNLYETVRQKATDRLKQVREKKVGELVDGTLDWVKRHPGPGVFVAAMAGFFLGRLFRR